VARQAALKDLTLDHLTNDRLHVCLCKRSQRLCANISKGATAQSKRGHGNVIWCLNNRDHVVLARVQKVSLTVAPHFFAISLKASVRFGESLTLRIPWSVKLASMM
jgi:hypothetical protein